VQLASNRRRKAIEIAIKRGDAGRLLVDRVGYVGVILIGCDSDESEQKHEKHEKTRQCEAGHGRAPPSGLNLAELRPIWQNSTHGAKWIVQPQSLDAE
jgi:hypothetical protein